MADDNGDEPKKAKGKKKKKKAGGKILIGLILGILIFFGGGGGLAWYMGWVHALMGWQKPISHAELEIGKPVFHPLPEIRTDMKTGECRAPFLRAVVHVQLMPEDVPRLQEAEMQVMDAILTHLRGQERQHVVGKEGSERLRFELVQIIQNIIRPAKVHTILFKELIVQ
ncbi:MAG: flagellar basal body-associated FliL family protein [Rhodospirillales bacterium]|nr:flagellar basal body-associated FliL family protein [Rhodospirillales bacterium]MBO6785842.1 flagellar basal body-associated FliL family protein [Rhodospirillales bacterium]